MNRLCMRVLGAAALMAIVLAGCAGPIEKADEYAAQDEWMKAVIVFRKAYSAHPRDIEYKERLQQMELKAADYYYQRGITLLDQDNVDGAIVQFQQGLAAMPEHSKLQQAIANALARKDANNLYADGMRAQEAGKNDEAMRLFQSALDTYPDHKLALAAYKKLQAQSASQDEDKLALASKSPITLNFKNTDIRTAFEFVARSFGINVIFDEAIKSTPITLFAKDVTFEQALDLMMATNKTFYKKVGQNTIIIIPDTKEKRGQYEDYMVRTFQLNTIKAKDMNDILKGVINLKKVFVNDQLNTLVVRDTPDTLKLVNKLVELNDRKPAEMILDVEILEVNRQKAEKLGLDLGSYSVSAAVPSTISTYGSIRNAISTSGVLTLPSATFQLYKQDVDAKTLANPKIRVINGKAAKIHVGDRVPLRAATITDATGQVRTTYDYKDIGIKLTVEPVIHVDNSATVKLGLEVSNLGANLGTQSEPAYSIGTREAETFMLLRDGETAILGGLIRDEDRHTRVRVPLLGDIPIVGSLFSSYDNSGGRTDVLLTITPRVVRGWDLPPKNMRQFYSGTADNYSDEPLFAGFDVPKRPGTKPTISQSAAANTLAGGSRSASPVAGAAPASIAAAAPAVPLPAALSGAAQSSAPGSSTTVAVPAAVAGVGVTKTAGDAAVTPSSATQAAQPGTNDAVLAPAASSEPTVSSVPPILAFSDAVYSGASEQNLEVRLVGQNLDGLQQIPIEILYNPQLLKFVSGAAGDFKPQDFRADADKSRGVARVTLNFAPGAGPKGSGLLATLMFKGAKAGVSYLVYKTPNLVDGNGSAVNAQVRAARVVLK